MIEKDYSFLLDRPEHVFDEAAIDRQFQGKRILITGAGGSIGSSLVQRILKSNPDRIWAVGHGEDSIFNLINCVGVKTVVPVIADAGSDRVSKVIRSEEISYVIHAAAHKHVGLMSLNPEAAYENNVRQTLALSAACRESKTRLVFVSTDKAANPTTIMGASKRLAEFALQAFYPDSTICRFGNVLGSAGSIVQIVEENARLKRVTKLRRGMKRFFITATEAVGLVLTTAPTPGLWTLDMGQPMSLRTLLSKLSCVWEEVDALPSEKLVEEICDFRCERMRASDEHAGIFQIIPRIYPGIIRAALDHAEHCPSDMVQIARRV